MSSPGPPGGTGTGPKKNQNGSATDETASNSDRRDEAKAEAPPERKPQSAGASMRDAAQRILTLALKGEWDGR
ncbi:hypothetical protein PVAND_004388 [Polypedilum vanderplanki]|uniref:Uncharacterized protein n=1 Tax=Polypedilum vanderplanki TaxID=319348 RepID=A0A9J6BX09_POLVA|nr:hypothetical protein PVAND_004388 [Polypedilum vanderplanki]